MMRFLIPVFAVVLAAGPVTAAEFSGMKSDVINNEGKTIGTFTLAGTNRGIVGRLELTAGALKPGWHAIHFHSVGDCSDTAKFENAKDHINLRHRQHGLLNRKGTESGDLPNVFALADGSVHAEISSQMVSLRGKRTLLDADGSALVIHANADDYMTQPTGGSGDRVACSVIKAK